MEGAPVRCIVLGLIPSRKGGKEADRKGARLGCKVSDKSEF